MLKDENRIIRHPETDENTKVPVMPVLVVLDNGIVGEAKTIRGAAALVIGDRYFDSEDAIDEWNYRLETSRREAMKVLIDNIYAVVYDSKKGIIDNNYAAVPGDPDYEDDEDEPPYKIMIDNDKVFLFSLMKLGAIRVLERADSFLLRPDNTTRKEDKICSKCVYKSDNKDQLVCSIYDEIKQLEDGLNCACFGSCGTCLDEYQGGTYIDIADEYDLDLLIEKAIAF